METKQCKEPSQRKGIFIRHQTRLILDSLSDEEYCRIIRQFDDYAFKGIEPVFEKASDIALFGFLKQCDDYDEASYREVIEKRRAAGKKGAEARWNKTA